MTNHPSKTTQSPSNHLTPDTTWLWSLVGFGGGALMSAIAGYQAFQGEPAWPFGLAAGLCLWYGRAIASEDAEASALNVWLGSLLIAVLILMTGLWVYQIFLLPNRTEAASTALVEATFRRDINAAKKALNDLDGQGDGRLLTVSAEQAKKVLTPVQLNRLNLHEPPYSLLSFTLASGDLATADLLLGAGHVVWAKDRYLLAVALANADAVQHARWRVLMDELANYRSRRLEGLRSAPGTRSVEETLYAGLLSNQADFSPLFTETEAVEALNRCDVATLKYIIDQDISQGKSWRLSLDPMLSQLIDKDMAALAPSEANVSELTDQQAKACLDTAKLLLSRAPFRHAIGDMYVFEGLFAGFSPVLWAEPFSKVMRASQTKMVADLRANAGLNEFDDVTFNLEGTWRYLDANPPIYPYTLQFFVLLLDKAPQASLLNHMFTPLHFYYHRALNSDVRRALQKWNASGPNVAHRQAIRDELNRSGYAMVDLGKAYQKQVNALRQWLSDLGLNCHPKIRGKVWPGVVAVKLGC